LWIFIVFAEFQLMLSRFLTEEILPLSTSIHFISLGLRQELRSPSQSHWR